MKVIVLLMALAVSYLHGRSQDTLLVKDGRIILCEIVRIDNSHVYYTTKTGNQKVQYQLSLDQVNDIRYFAPNINENETNTKKHFIRFSIGACLSSGDFGSVDLSNFNSAFADNGFHIGANYLYLFSNDFALSAIGYYNRNEYLSIEIGKLISNYSGYYVTTDPSYYQSFGLMLGPTASVSIDKTLTLNWRFHVGLAILTRSDATYHLSYASQNYGWVREEKIAAASLGINLGGDISYRILKKTELVFSLDNFRGSFDFGEATFRDSAGNSSKYEEGKYKYETICISLGLAFKF